PHSEVSSLAVFLHILFEGKELDKEFKGGKMKVVPTAEGKKIIIQNK
ncbi:MAG: tRNA (cytidine(56)-2'-O)-methyltransferase, partial [Methanobacterium sp.]